MRKVFWDNPYQHSLVLLADTIAFSFSGGQESDKASINGFNVINSEIIDKLIYYTLEDGHGLSIGDKVTMVIDWPRRYRLMRLHCNYS